MKKKGSKLSGENYWISFSDLMTGLMVIFMFIAISYIIEIQNKQRERDLMFEEFKSTRENLYYELKNKFEDQFKVWNVELDKDLSIKFTNPDVLFGSGEVEIRPKFKVMLDSFFPQYFDILLQDKYKDKIVEVRIEGHTDTVPIPKYDGDPYIGNVILSQLRSTEVLKYFRNMDYFKKLPDEKKRRLQFWLTSNGLSYGRTLDADKKLTFFSNKPINKEYSRRVEFRIITSSEKLVDSVLNQIKK